MPIVEPPACLEDGRLSRRISTLRVTKCHHIVPRLLTCRHFSVHCSKVGHGPPMKVSWHLQQLWATFPQSAGIGLSPAGKKIRHPQITRSSTATERNASCVNAPNTHLEFPSCATRRQRQFCCRGVEPKTERVDGVTAPDEILNMFRQMATLSGGRRLNQPESFRGSPR